MNRIISGSECIKKNKWKKGEKVDEKAVKVVGLWFYQSLNTEAPVIHTVWTVSKYGVY